MRDEGLTNRTFAALTAGGLACLLALGTPSGAAAAAEREASDDDLLHWLLRPRWQRHVPESPASPSVVEVALDHVAVSWTAPEGGAFEIVDYDVQFRPTDADGFSAWTHEGAATEITVTGLERGTAYEFVCAPRTRRGRAVTTLGTSPTPIRRTFRYGFDRGPQGFVAGLVPGAAYEATMGVEIATRTPSGCFDIGGAPGESVWIKAGATGVEPLPILIGGDLRMNVDVGNQSQGGENAVVLGNVANSRSCEQPP